MQAADTVISGSVSFARDPSTERPATLISTPEKALAIHRYEQEEPLVLATVKSTGAHPTPACFLEGGEKAVGPGPGGAVHVWDARNGAVLHALKVQHKVVLIAVSLIQLTIILELSDYFHRVQLSLMATSALLQSNPSPVSKYGRHLQSSTPRLPYQCCFRDLSLCDGISNWFV